MTELDLPFVEIDDDVYETLAAAAELLGMTVEDYANMLLMEFINESCKKEKND